MTDHVAAATRLLEALAPGKASVAIREPLAIDESEWFLRAVEEGIIEFEDCPPDCFRLKKWGVPGPDHFTTPAGKPRHLFSKPIGPEAWLNREYVPHIAAFAYAIVDRHYDRGACSFSLYRKFSRDLIRKRAGTTFETDAEFFSPHGSIYLQVEAKASKRQTAALAVAIDRHGNLTELPTSAAKEIEYVLELAPQFLWVVGPGSVDPATNVFAVEMRGPLNASFTRLLDLPVPPSS